MPGHWATQGLHRVTQGLVKNAICVYFWLILARFGWYFCDFGGDFGRVKQTCGRVKQTWARVKQTMDQGKADQRHQGTF